MRTPTTRTDDVVDILHGVPVPDPYRWLEQPDSEETRAWVEAQNAVTRAFLDASPHRGALRERLVRLWNHPRVGLPVREGGRVFQTRNDGLQEQPVLEVIDPGAAAPRALLDPNALSADGTVALGPWAPSRDGRWLAWAVSDGGSDWHTWRVRDVETGVDLPVALRWSKFSGAAWLPDGSGFLVGRYDPPVDGAEAALRHQRLVLHRLGEPEERVFVARPDEPDWGFAPTITADDALGLVIVWRGTSRQNLLWAFDPADLDAGTRPIVDAWIGRFDPIEKVGRHLYVLTDLDAPRQRVIRVDLDDPRPEAWTEIVPEGPHLLQAASVVGDRLVLVTLEHAQSAVRTVDLDGRPLGALALPEAGTAGGFDGRPGEDETFFWFSSFVRPTTIYRWRVSEPAPTVHHAPELPWEADRYTTEQVFATSADGTRVPLFLSYRRDLPRDGRLPTLLYGYGGFNIPVTPAFSVSNAVWMELGGVYASACLRGGGEYGSAWHEAGTRARKQNTFDDFIACAEWLAGNGWTTPDRLASRGGSNGGLLVAATLLQRPDLFGAALPAVGVLDMLRFHRFTIGWAWASDYGTADDPDDFRVLLRYSPVHNCRPGDWPATLVLTADHDDRVVPAHSYKFTAALQAAQRGPAPVLIRVETRAGHGAGKSTSMLIEQAVDEQAFLLRALAFEPRWG